MSTPLRNHGRRLLGQHTDKTSRSPRAVWAWLSNQVQFTPETGAGMQGSHNSRRHICASPGCYCGAQTKDHFALFGLNAGFDIDNSRLDSTYKALQQQCHPDRHATASQAEQDAAAERSALVNQAYSVLKSPLQRAKYVLKQAGHEEDQAGEGTIEDPVLLMRVMEARESVESAEGDEELQGMQSDNLREQESCLQALSAAFRQQDWGKAVELTTELRYITRIGEAIKLKL